MNKFLKYWLPVVIWAGFIFYLSSIPNLRSGLEPDFFLRKLAHIIEYAILVFLSFRALYNGQQFSLKKSLVLAFIFSFLYAISDEFHQTFIINRDGNIKDILVDSMGIIFAVFLIKKRVK